MGNFFKKANREEVIRFETPDGEDFIEFRASLSKAEANAILSAAPSEQGDIEGGLFFISRYVERAGVRWSFTDENGEPVPLTLENYLDLDAVAARWVDERAGEAMQQTIGKQIEKLEGESTS